MKRSDRPKVIANFAITADGKVTTRRHTPATFTSSYDKQRLLEIRALTDAILVGRNTVATDSMSMTLSNRSLQAKRRTQGRSPQPLRVIVTNRGNLDPMWKVFQMQGAPRIIFSTTSMPSTIQQALHPLCELHLFDCETVPIDQVLGVLRKVYRARILLCEGGPTLLRSLIEINALDELYLTIAPVIFGGLDAPTLTGGFQDFLPKIAHFRLESMRKKNDECYLHYRAT